MNLFQTAEGDLVLLVTQFEIMGPVNDPRRLNLSFFDAAQAGTITMLVKTPAEAAEWMEDCGYPPMVVLHQPTAEDGNGGTRLVPAEELIAVRRTDFAQMVSLLDLLAEALDPDNLIVSPLERLNFTRILQGDPRGVSSFVDMLEAHEDWWDQLNPERGDGHPDGSED